MACQEILDLAHDLRHGNNKNLVVASIIDAYIELVTCSPRKRRYVIKNINHHSNIINRIYCE